MLGDRHYTISEKYMNKQWIDEGREEEINDKYWSLATGYVLNKLPKKNNLRVRKKLIALGRESLKAIGYDFGAVDIMMGQDKQLYVLEVNSAPALNEYKLELYCKYFEEEEGEVL